MNPFATAGMAEGYAKFRPPLHRVFLEAAMRRVQLPGKIGRALDVGCGAGLSTQALDGIGEHRIGIDPAVPMLRGAAHIAPGADFLAGRAEAIPVAGRCVDLITAAGSLNYADLGLFFREAVRILVPGGVVVVYDFSPGEAVDDWLANFIARYPWPEDGSAELEPARLAGIHPDFRLAAHEELETGLTLTLDFYLEYMMTETNVANAIRTGVPEGEIRSWCRNTLTPIWGGQPRRVVFRGYFACLIVR